MASCKTCKAELPTKAERCPRCGVPQGDLLEEAIGVIEKYDEGCEPRTYREYDEEG